MRGKVSTIVFLIAGLTFQTACNRDTKDTSLVVLPDEILDTKFSLSDIAEDLLIIPLSSNYPVQRFQKVVWYDSCFYYFSQNKIVRFTEGGHFVDALDKLGRGPDQYLSCYEFQIHDATGEIYILDRSKIQVYTNSFNHQRTIKPPGPQAEAVKMRIVKDNIHIFYHGYEKEGLLWAMTDMSGNVISSSYAVDFYESMTLDESQVFENNGKLYRFYNKNDTIYEIDSTGIRPYRLINRDFRDGFHLIKNPTKYSLSGSPSTYREIRSIYGTGDFWQINFTKVHYTKRNPIENESVLYDTRENDFWIIGNSFAKPGAQGSIGIHNDWAGHGYFLPFGELTNNNRKYLLRVYDASEYLAMVNDNEFRNGTPSRPEIKARMISVADSLTHDDNPVLILLKLKN